MSRHHRKIGIVVVLISLIGAALLSGCGPSLPKDQTERELQAFMLDYILLKETRSGGSYSRSGPRPWAEAPEDAHLIVFAPPVDKPDESGIDYLQTDAPIMAWWFANGQLVEITDKKEAIQAFRQQHFSGVGSSRSWGYYEYGILSTSNGNREAKVYLGESCGPLCGQGTIFTLQRNDSGEWVIQDAEGRWIS